MKFLGLIQFFVQAAAPAGKYSQNCLIGVFAGALFRLVSHRWPPASTSARNPSSSGAFSTSRLGSSRRVWRPTANTSSTPWIVISATRAPASPGSIGPHGGAVHHLNALQASGPHFLYPSPDGPQRIIGGGRHLVHPARPGPQEDQVRKGPAGQCQGSYNLFPDGGRLARHQSERLANFLRKILWIKFGLRSLELELL
jgi:hypothetical protein